MTGIHHAAFAFFFFFFIGLDSIIEFFLVQMLFACECVRVCRHMRRQGASTYGLAVRFQVIRMFYMRVCSRELFNLCQRRDSFSTSSDTQLDLSTIFHLTLRIHNYAFRGGEVFAVS